MNRKRRIISGLDGWTLVIVLAIALFGWLNIYGAGYTFEQSSIWDFANRAGKQLVWIFTAIVMGIMVFSIDEKTYDSITYFLYAAMLLLLLATPLLAHNIKGSYSWITLGPISLQPAEFAKCFTALAIAKYMSQYEYRLRYLRDYGIPIALIIVPMGIIMFAQRETGSALVFLSFLLVFYRQGMSGYVLLLGLVSILLSVLIIRFGGIPLSFGNGSVGIWVTTLILQGILIVFLWGQERNGLAAWLVLVNTLLCYGVGLLLQLKWNVSFDWIGLISLFISIGIIAFFAILQRRISLGLLIGFTILEIVLCQGCDFAFQRILQPHQRTRIEVLLGMKDDPTGAGYNVNQSLIAIGSGQFSGKGYLQGTQTKLQFVPEQDTDFIFCTVGEEWGFIGSIFLLFLYLALIWRIIYLGERQRDRFCRIFAYSVASIILFHVTINIGMVLGLLPVIGIPLPFFSYGGSSLWGFSLMMAILLRLDAARINRLQ